MNRRPTTSRASTWFCLLLTVLVAGAVKADPPQPDPAPILGASDLAWLESRTAFRVGISHSQVPLAFDTGDGELAGVWIDYLAQLSDKLNVSLNPLLLDGSAELPGAEPDLVLTTRIPDAPVIPGVRYTTPLMSLTYGVFVNTGEGAIRSLTDLESARVAIIANDPNQFPLLNPVEHFTPVPVASLSDAVSKVMSGQADAFLGPVPVVSDYLDSAMIKAIGLAVLLNQRPVDVVFQIEAGKDEMFRAFDRAVTSLSHQDHRAIRQVWLQGRAPVVPDQGLTLTASEQAWLANRASLRVGLRTNWPPFEFYQHGRPSGLVNDLLNRLEQDLDVPIERVPIDNTSSGEERLKAGDIDILPGMSKTPRTEQEHLFTRAYVTVPIALAIRDNGRFIGDLRELRDERVGVVSRQASHDYLLINHPNLDIYPQKTVEDGLLALSNGDLDVMVTHIPAVSYTVARLGLSNLRITSITPYQYDLRLAVRPDMPELNSILSKALNNLPASETESIYNRWIHLDIEQEADYTVVRRIILIAIVVVLIFLYWNRKLSL
ncbi:MAG TPA: transporter substrate-binding domain-containing protein, partial [Marinobacter sp.]|nr:transporter substrate-binding domain-containing protein [Marinobacter sp.]